jgi:four helix bundle protein
MARGSLFEVQNQLYAARDTALVDEANFEELLNNSLVAQRLLIGLINATRRRTT